MTIIGIARVPGITSLDREDTHPVAVPRDRIRGLINRTTVQPADAATEAYGLGVQFGRTLDPVDLAAMLAYADSTRADHTDPIALRFIDGVKDGLRAPVERQMQGCPAWCVAQGQHLAGEHPDDRAHFSEGREVFRTLDTVPGDRPKPPAWANLVHFADEPQPRINAFLGADHAVDLTPAEARQYAAALLELADLAEQTGGPR